MVEEIFNYKAPIAVIPEISLAKADLYKWEKKLRRLSNADSITACEFEIKRARERVDAILAMKRNVPTVE